jgi:YD repeat-containing protein
VTPYLAATLFPLSASCVVPAEVITAVILERPTFSNTPNGVVTEYTYDAASRVTGLAFRQGATTLGTLSYMYDAAGHRLRVGGTWARTGLPPALASASYDAANRHLTFGGQVLTYDLNGNLVNDGTSGYTWDARNRLTGITGPIVNSRLICATFSLPECATGRGTVSARVYPDRGGKASALSHGTKHDQIPQASGAVQHADRGAGRL